MEISLINYLNIAFSIRILFYGVKLIEMST